MGQKRKAWETTVRIFSILCTVLHEAHKRQVEETMDTLAEEPKGFYGEAGFFRRNRALTYSSSEYKRC